MTFLNVLINALLGKNIEIKKLESLQYRDSERTQKVLLISNLNIYVPELIHLQNTKHDMFRYHFL